MENELNLATVAKYFSDEEKVREFLKAIRWPDSPFCPHCGEIGNTHKKTMAQYGNLPILSNDERGELTTLVAFAHPDPQRYICTNQTTWTTR